MFKKITSNNKGITLLEMIVAVAIFTTMILLTTRIFQSAVEGQRNAIAAQNTQESMRFAFEVMSKEIRMAKRNDGTCKGALDPTKKVYNIEIDAFGNDILYFINKDDKCVEYSLAASRFHISRDDGVNTVSQFITPDEVKISNLKFEFEDDDIGDFHSLQPRVLISMEAEMAGGKKMHKQKMIMQTTVSSRYYE